MIFFDLETTGVDTQNDRIVQICVKKGDEIKTMLINPEIPISPEASEVHGITDDMVKDAPTFSQISKSLYKYIYGEDLAGFNSNKFDVPMLVKEFERAGIDFDVSKINLIDVSNIYRRLNPRNLQSAYKQYVGEEFDDAHDAQADVLATERLFKEINKQHSDELKDIDLNLYSNYDRERIDLAGMFVKNNEGNLIFGFGKHVGKEVGNHLSYVEWILYKSDFPKDTKKVARKILKND